MLILYLPFAICCVLVAASDSTLEKASSSSIQKYPYIISIEYNGVYVGGGSIINRYFALTALEVIDVPYKDLLTVRTGSNFSNKNGSVHNVCNVTIHPSASLVNVALLQLLEPINFDGTRQPIRFFNVDDELKPGTKVIVSNWPKILVSDSSSLKIEEASISKKNCSKDVFRDGVFCIDKPRGNWELLTGLGHPVEIDGLQAGIIIRTYESLTYVIELAPFTRWIRQTMQELFVEQCSAGYFI